MMKHHLLYHGVLLVIFFLCAFSFLYTSLWVVNNHIFGWQMTSESLIHTRFVDGACHHTLNLASAAWVIYEPSS